MNVNIFKLQQSESDQIKKLRQFKGPGQRQDPAELSPGQNTPFFKHAQTKDQLKLNKNRPDQAKHYHRHKKKRMSDLLAIVLRTVLLLQMASPVLTITKDLSALPKQPRDIYSQEFLLINTTMNERLATAFAPGVKEQHPQLLILSQPHLTSNKGDTASWSCARTASCTKHKNKQS
ncbi:hypothetical protein ABBQ38_012330 [Trebouxia sp. C0009 RCD-2024]